MKKLKELGLYVLIAVGVLIVVVVFVGWQARNENKKEQSYKQVQKGQKLKTGDRVLLFGAETIPAATDLYAYLGFMTDSANNNVAGVQKLKKEGRVIGFSKYTDGIISRFESDYIAVINIAGDNYFINTGFLVKKDK